MINFKPELVGILSKVNDNVVETYPDDWIHLPVIVYEEEQNAPYDTTTAGEKSSEIRYRIEVYSNNSTSELKKNINTALTDRGFTRESSIDTHDQGGRRHTVMRYAGVIDHETGRIFKR